ncbi:5-dehydro-4-deoxyglucarate dehydratase [Corynebacterium ammoniagenes]|uniref:Probable 5-dehydro-4-deoxyglucarate dehydratase n=1 Tax=Corynebacterium ammoniagenes TaxID=1697 RepID=A0AAV5GAD7_CORAM|nr:5-dehydro-4-deoxyglucarate dehydratase [Corynebacterium ammoniagenes]GJN43628.1 putative 5-dehydro-4-deoxyglucarate dehydratase [Corynebacterium ammoniagenes]
MSRFTPTELQQHLKDGLLSFPVTAFDSNLEVDEKAYQNHIEWQSSYPVAGLFAAGGTGEGFSLTPEENYRVTKLAVEASHADVPVLGSAGGNTHQAIEHAQGAENAGAEGLLLLPPYLTECDQDGLFEHASAIIASTSLSVIVYNRANAVYEAETLARLAERHENFVGYKDATADIEHLARVTTTNGDRLFYLGGLPTAETYALSLLELGMSTYSSAMFNFVPDFALNFYRDVRAQNTEEVQRKLKEFVLPYLNIRDRGQGFGVSIVKGGLKVQGRDCGPVRPPLQDLSEKDLDDLRNLIELSGAGAEIHETSPIHV